MVLVRSLCARSPVTQREIRISAQPGIGLVAIVVAFGTSKWRLNN